MGKTISAQEAVTFILDYRRNVSLPSGKEVGGICDHNPCASAANDKIAFLVQQERGGELLEVLQPQIVTVPGHESDVVVIEVVIEQDAGELVAEGQVARGEAV